MFLVFGPIINPYSMFWSRVHVGAQQADEKKWMYLGSMLNTQNETGHLHRKFWWNCALSPDMCSYVNIWKDLHKIWLCPSRYVEWNWLWTEMHWLCEKTIHTCPVCLDKKDKYFRWLTRSPGRSVWQNQFKAKNLLQLYL